MKTEYLNSATLPESVAKECGYPNAVEGGAWLARRLTSTKVRYSITCCAIKQQMKDHVNGGYAKWSTWTPIDDRLNGTASAPYTTLAERRAAQPLRPSAPQDFDLSPLPLWSDASKQKELF